MRAAQSRLAAAQRQVKEERGYRDVLQREFDKDLKEAAAAHDAALRQVRETAQTDAEERVKSKLDALVESMAEMRESMTVMHESMAKMHTERAADRAERAADRAKLEALENAFERMRRTLLCAQVALAIDRAAIEFVFEARAAQPALAHKSLHALLSGGSDLAPNGEREIKRFEEFQQMCDAHGALKSIVGALRRARRDVAHCKADEAMSAQQLKVCVAFPFPTRSLLSCHHLSCCLARDRRCGTRTAV